jgi:hypothetical protein
MSRRDRQRVELKELCRTGGVSRAVDLAFAHFAEFGPDKEIVDALSRALDRTPDASASRRRFDELREVTWATPDPEHR